jgi:hypothetical protein
MEEAEEAEEEEAADEEGHTLGGVCIWGGVSIECCFVLLEPCVCFVY